MAVLLGRGFEREASACLAGWRESFAGGNGSNSCFYKLFCHTASLLLILPAT